MRIWGVIMNPVKDLNVSQFLVEACQGSSPLRHIGLFYFWDRTLGPRLGSVQPDGLQAYT
jgi:hypothetical protein